MAESQQVRDLEAQLGSFVLAERQQALSALLAGGSEPAPMAEVANMHCHSFFSFNA